jgi:hypothetical protein
LLDQKSGAGLASASTADSTAEAPFRKRITLKVEEGGAFQEFPLVQGLSLLATTAGEPSLLPGRTPALLPTPSAKLTLGANYRIPAQALSIQ